MRCKKHATDLSTIVGVCASCLRERLLRLIAAQEQYEAQLLANKHSNSETNPAFPRSVSPYITRRKSDNSVAPDASVPRPYNKPRLHHSLSDQRFYSSPQIAVTTGGCIGNSSSNRKKPNLIRFSSFSNLFRSNNNGNGDSDSNSNSREPCGGAGQPTSVTSSPAWFSNVLPGGGSSNHKKKKSSDFDESSTTAASGGVVRKQRCYRNRGMSPVRSFDDGGEDEFSDGSSEYESVESCKQTPRKTPSTIRRGGGGHRSVSEMIFCLSPLVRASPNRLWSHKGKPPVDGGGDGRVPVVPHLSNAKSFCANRSRKLADFGRSDPNR